MPAIVRRLPYFSQPMEISVQGQRIALKADQIIVWISVSQQGVKKFRPEIRQLPAIFDTGCNHSLVIRREHLLAWAGLNPDRLEKFRNIRVQGREASQIAANVWLHRNVPGQRDARPGVAPHLMELPRGIAVLRETADDNYPRLPLLGLRALRMAKLDAHISGTRCQLTLRTTPWWGLFG
jgi:hypothetical protein